MRSFVELLADHARDIGARPAYTFLKNGEVPQRTVSFAELHQRVKSISATLQRGGYAGQRAMLFFPSGIDYIEAFLGCMFAGVIPVPSYLPHGSRMVPRVRSIVTDCQPALALGPSDKIRSSLDSPGLLDGVGTPAAFIGTESIAFDQAESWTMPELKSDSIAFLQYTSGSTGDPRGVVLTHGNVMANQRMIEKAFGHTDESVVVSWLPPYHDMGLIGCILQPLYLGVHCVVMAPAAFMQKPSRWLRAISDYRATTSGGPNFAYDLCIDKVKDEDIETLDLSSWKVAFNGAEPVRAKTLDRFSQAFKSAGFRQNAFLPCYGLAEATLIVTCSAKSPVPIVAPFDKDALERGKAVITQAEASLPPSHGSSRNEGLSAGSDATNSIYAHTVASVPSSTIPPIHDGSGSEESRIHLLVGCGEPVLNTSIKVVDPESSQECSSNTLGEIWVRGQGVAAGYWNGTNKSRKDDFHPTVDAEGWLHTGDLGFLHEGNVFLTGRLKDLIVIRGRNHFPDDIEQTAEAAHPDLRPTSSVAFSCDRDGAETLVVVAEIQRKQEANAKAAALRIREAVAAEHEIAAADVVIVPPGSVPKTTSGKVRRSKCRSLYMNSALPCLSYRQPEQEHKNGIFTPPETEAEETIAGIWRRHLSIERVGIDESFFKLGGDSLAALQVAFEMEGAFGVPFPFEKIFDDPTIRGLARHIHLVHRKDASLRNLLPRPSPNEFPVTPSQKAIWIACKLEPQSSAYHIPIAVRLSGELDFNALQRSLDQVISRHDILRGRIRVEDGEPWMSIAETLNAPIQFRDLANDPDPEKAESLNHLKRENASAPFVLDSGPLLRVCLIKTGPNEHILHVVAHHLISDGWSFLILFKEWSDCYGSLRGSNKPLEPVYQYGDHAAARQEWVKGQGAAADLSWWKDYLKAIGPVSLPADRSARELGSFSGMTVSRTVHANLLAALKDMVKTGETTLFVVLLTVLKAHLHRLSRQESIAVGFPSANRKQDNSGAIGLFVSTLVTQTEISGETGFTEILQYVKRDVAEALRRQDTPITAIEERGLAREGSPRVNVFFNLLNLPFETLAFGDVDASLAEEPCWGSKFDLTFYARENDGTLSLTLLYDESRFSAPMAVELLEQYVSLLQQIAENPQAQVSTLSLMTDRARRCIPDASEVHEQGEEELPPAYRLFERQVQERPDAPAIMCSKSEWTYEELDRRANKLAGYLISQDVKSEEVVAIYASRSEWLVSAMLAVHKAGGAFVILDRKHPPLRLLRQLKVAKPKVTIVLSAAGELPADLAQYADAMGSLVFRDYGLSSYDEDGVLASIGEPIIKKKPKAADLAYLAFTSGTTGEPLCVEGAHGPLSHFVDWYIHEFEFQPERERFSLLSGLAHDPILRDIFGALCSGNTVVIPPGEGFDEPRLLAAWLKDSSATVAHLTPSLWEYLMSAMTAKDKEGVSVNEFRHLFFGGEVLTGSCVRSARSWAPEAKITNFYGATETPQAIAYYELSPSDDSGLRIPIGKGRTRDVQLLILNQDRHPCGVGERGEICVRSRHLVRGYRNGSASDAARFISDHFPLQLPEVDQATSMLFKESNEAAVQQDPQWHESNSMQTRIYRTGDIGWYDSCGFARIEGRSDRQISIAGFRIEPSEIEEAVREHPLVDQCAVLAQDGLGAFYAADSEIPQEALRSFVAARIPNNAVPENFIWLKSMPLTSNGKLDQARLRALSESRAAVETSYAATPLEEKIASIWRNILGRESIGPKDDFFKLGGTSIKAVRIASLIQTECKIKLPLKVLFKARTVSLLASWIERETMVQASADSPDTEMDVEEILI